MYSCYEQWNGVIGMTVQGNINLIEAAKAKGVKKFVLVTSIGTGDSKDAPPKQVYDVLKSVLIQKAKAEDKLKVLFCQNLEESGKIAAGQRVIVTSGVEQSTSSTQIVLLICLLPFIHI